MAEFTPVCFIGDSITAAEKYTRILVDYFVLHCPKKKYLFHTVAIPGIGSDTILPLWDTLITPRQPAFATVMFGMNDLHRSLYSDSAKITNTLLARRENALEAYIQNMKILVSKLDKTPSLVMTPTPHDESPAIDAPLYGGYDNMLKRAGQTLTEIVPSVLDVHTPLAEANRKGLVRTVIGPDRVHPGNIGHAIIAYTILEHLGFKTPRLPLWDDSYTAEEKATLEKLGIREDTAPKNPYSDLRCATQRRLSNLYYVEFNALAAAGIGKSDTKAVNKFLSEQQKMPIEQWRVDAYTDYIENGYRLSQIEKETVEAMKNMYL